ncbi:MAG TPA: 2-C-methyl-D-erythritol 4-phosphate cytidylyltransferase [Egibacteraceae bacterium]|nr:2-C-methyl-D-erythritol 4-phosphate cytidylyltransferase [Egibacteraceae bacterium]
MIVAAGAGLRLGASQPKAFVELAGQAMVLHAISAFQRSASVDDIVVVVPPDHQETATQVLPPGVTCVPGGLQRQESVSAGLSACPSSVRVVAVHDAARPLVTPDLIDRTIAAMGPPWDAVAPGVPIVDTLKQVDPRSVVLRTIDRTGVWAVQTPQVATRATLERVHARVAPSADAATDDLSLIERAGGRVHLIHGDWRNLKVTSAGDLAIAEQLLSLDVS